MSNAFPISSRKLQHEWEFNVS